MNFREFRASIKENKMLKPTSPKMRLQMAISIALDMGGNMTGAYKKIEKIERGLGDHPAVKAALRFANESVNEKLSDADKKKRLIMIRKAVEKMKDKELKMAKKDALAAIKALESVDVNELNGQTGPVLKVSYKPQRAGGKLTSHSTITKSDLYNDVVYNNKNWKITANTNSIEMRLPRSDGDERDRKHFLDLIKGATGDVSNLIRGGSLTKSEVMELKKDYEKAVKAFGATKVVSQDHSIYVSHDKPGGLKVKEGLLAMLKALDEFGMRNHISLNSRNGVLTQIQDAGQYNESVKESAMDTRERKLNIKMKELEYKMKLADFIKDKVEAKIKTKEDKKKLPEADTSELKVSDTSSTTFNKLNKIAKDVGVEISREENHLKIVGDAKKMGEFKSQMSVAMKESKKVKEGTMAIGIKDRDPKERARAQAQLKVMLKKIGNKKVGSKEGQDFDDKLDYDILSDDILADEFANPKNKNMKVKDLLKKHSKRLNVNFDESVEEGFADRQREKTKSQQKAHQKSMIKIARKSIKDYEKRNKKEEIEENADASLKKKSEKSGISVGILKQVYNRGVAAWKTGHRPGTTPEQWGHARVNSFITKGSGTWGKADKDLAKKAGG